MREVTIYTDGSHFKNGGSGRRGCGGIMVVGGEIVDEFSFEATTSYLQENYGTTMVSNPTMEMLGALIALREFEDNFRPGDKITLKADYLGVREWCTGKWRIKEPYIKAIYDDIQGEIKRQKLRITFEWVKGHQSGTTGDAYYNNIVDLLAKGERHGY